VILKNKFDLLHMSWLNEQAGTEVIISIYSTVQEIKLLERNKYPIIPKVILLYNL